MNREERVRAALASKDVDRVPVATWMHLSQFDQDPISLAEAEVELTEKYDFDYIKMMPFGLYSTQDFGNQLTILMKNQSLKDSPSRALLTMMH